MDNLIFKILQEDKKIIVSEELKNYYSYIDTWDSWWKGYIKKYHEYTTSNIKRNPVNVKRKTLRMAKKVSEDWANLLLNDKTLILVSDEESQKFLTGDENEQIKGALGACKFWTKGNKAIEKAYALGTAAFILELVKPKITGRELSATSVAIKTIKDARMLIPLSYDDDEIKDLAISSIVNKSGKKYIYLQTFTALNSGDYEITNDYYEINSVGYKKVKNLNGEVDSYKLPCKPFFILKPLEENNIADVPLGMSRYANAEDQLGACDVAFDNLYNDIILGRKKVFMDESVLAMDEIPILDEYGKPKRDEFGQVLTRKHVTVGDTVEQSFFYSMGDRDPNREDRLFKEWNPDLRIEANAKAIQLTLNLLSSKVGFGQHRYKFDVQSMNTATEVKITNKDLTESVWKQRIGIQDILVEMVKNILILAKEKCGLKVNPESNISIKFDDTMFSDEESERTRALQEVRDGLMAKYEYRMKYYGEDEATAKAKVAEMEKGSEEKEPEIFDE